MFRDIETEKACPGKGRPFLCKACLVVWGFLSGSFVCVMCSNRFDFLYQMPTVHELKSLKYLSAELMMEKGGDEF